MDNATLSELKLQWNFIAGMAGYVALVTFLHIFVIIVIRKIYQSLVKIFQTFCCVEIDATEFSRQAESLK